jgi:hypothetical protein
MSCDSPFKDTAVEMSAAIHCGEPAILNDSCHVSLVQWTNLFAFRHKGHRFKSPGGTYVKPGFIC